MYRISLTQSYFPAQADEPVLQTTVPGILRDAARLHADAPALAEARADGTIGRCWTYAELLADAEKLALALSTRFAPGERIAVWAPNLPEWEILEFAAGMAGLILVTINPAYQAKELRYVLTQSRSVALFLTREYRGNPMAEIAAQVTADIPAIRCGVDMEDPIALHACGERSAVLPEVRPGDTAQIQYTSGTTGFPKGALLHHSGLTNNARYTMGRMEPQDGDTFLNPMPMFHTAGCAIVALGAAQFGARHILVRQFDPGHMIALMESERVCLGFGVPTMIIAMLEAFDRHPRDVSQLRVIMSGGAMVPPEIVRRTQDTFGCDFEIVYGQTETSPVITLLRRSDSFADKTETAGQAVPQTEIAIRDAATGAIVPVGAVGEICARGHGIMQGYNDNPEATAQAIDAEGWLHTGDLGTLDERGYLRITGRLKDMIIRGGENLFPAEIENVLLEHPAIAEVSVVGVPDDKWGEIAVCFFRPAGALPKREELVAHVRKHLAAPKTPAHWIAVESFPLTGSGKIQKFVLRDRFIAGEFADRL
jgi:fatty-acyl-CoA synthase